MKLYDLAVKTREYTGRDGQKKAVWQNVGVLMKSQDGRPYLLLERWFSPAGIPTRDGSSSIIISCFPPRKDNDERVPEETTGDIPF